MIDGQQPFSRTHCRARPCSRRPASRGKRLVRASSSAWQFLCAVCLLLLNTLLAHAQTAIQLRDVTSRTGISFRHTDGASGKRYIVETVSAGLALFDFDLDGDIDIYFLNGKPLSAKASGPVPRNALYRNEGNLRFTDVTESSGVGDTGYGLGVAIADYDNDGDQDIYLNNYGPNVLYRNNGDGTFSDATAIAGVANGNKVGAGTCFLDIDADGDLDLYVANYVQFSPETFVPRFDRGIPRYPGPVEFAAEPDDLYRNEGDGTFTNVSVASNIAASAGTGMGTISSDFDGDGDSDIFVCNDATANFLFQNDGTGRFDEVGLLAGVAYNIDGEEDASMGVDCADYDHDGLMDFFTTNHYREVPVLYRNLGAGLFEDATLATGAGAGSFQHVTWGTGFVDFDNDGERDIFIASGHTDDTIQRVDKTQEFKMPNVLLANIGNGKFIDISAQAGDGLTVKQASRGTGFDDLDNDGDVDVVILNMRGKPTILENTTQTGHNWLQVQLQGVQSNGDGVGARVEVVAGDLRQVDEVHSGRGYQSHHGTRLYFGLGNEKAVDMVVVHWLGGGTDVRENVKPNQLLHIKQTTAEPR